MGVAIKDMLLHDISKAEALLEDVSTSYNIPLINLLNIRKERTLSIGELMTIYKTYNITLTEVEKTKLKKHINSGLGKLNDIIERLETKLKV